MLFLYEIRVRGSMPRFPCGCYRHSYVRLAILLGPAWFVLYTAHENRHPKEYTQPARDGPTENALQSGGGRDGATQLLLPRTLGAVGMDRLYRRLATRSPCWLLPESGGGESPRREHTLCLPAFMVVGAMKCATTAIAAWLNAHSEIEMSLLKEPGFWSSLPPVLDVGSYGALFPQLPNNSDVLTFEATPTYLDNPDDPYVGQLLRLWMPSLRVLALVRDPTSRAYSQYQLGLALQRSNGSSALCRSHTLPPFEYYVERALPLLRKCVSKHLPPPDAPEDSTANWAKWGSLRECLRAGHSRTIGALQAGVSCPRVVTVETLFLPGLYVRRRAVRQRPCNRPACVNMLLSERALRWVFTTMQFSAII
eukprot:SAG11_NODE_184_length_13162_cov_9.151803_14_plen_366_part_00